MRAAHAQDSRSQPGSVQAEDTQASGQVGDTHREAVQQFQVGDIHVEGLERISEGTVYNYLPINIGDRLDPNRIREAIKALYATGFFRDVELRRDGGTLIVAVLERPTIESFEVKGNKDIKTEDLQRSLRNVGLASGKSFDASVLEEVKRYLTEQYFSRGKYAVKVDAKAEEVPGNRVKVAIDITEGSRARIRQINVVGNRTFSEQELLGEFQLSTPNWLSWYKQDDRYAKESLTGDLEALRSYYMDRGYADFEIVSNQVAISPEKDEMFITVNVREGELYRLAEVKFAGNLVVPESELRRLTALAAGQTYSRRLITQTSEAIRMRLGLDGYAFAKIDAVPKLDADRKEIALSLVIDPGNRAYVRRINFHGSSGVNDEVFRRELRQLEGAYLSSAAVDRSKQRIQRLPFIEKAEAETVPVPGTPDLVDVDFNITEGLPGQFGGSIGYSESSSIILSGNVVHSNFLGTGERIALEMSGGQYGRGFDVSHTNPYVTMDGISRTLNFSYRDSYQLDSESSDFSSKTWLTSSVFSYPITEFQSMQFSAAWQRVNLASAYYSSQQLEDWITANGNTYERDYYGTTLYGTEYDAFELGLAWVFDSRDRTLFPTRGANHRLSISATPPGSEVQYYLANYDYRQFFRLPYLDKLPFSFNTRIAYGAPLGDTTALPPQRNFRVGGAGSLRGFGESTLGPRDSQGNPYGGDLAVTGQVEMIIPMPDKFAASARATIFYDFGQVAYVGDTKFTDKGGFPVEYPFDLGLFRSSVGVGVEWLAPLGLFRFSYAIPLRYRRGTELNYGDDVEGFQFSMGNAF
jgi:outer membrane protein insertion porin family